MAMTMVGSDGRPHDAFRGGRPRPPIFQTNHQRKAIMQWIDPAYCDIRLGFEVTAYVYVR